MQKHAFILLLVLALLLSGCRSNPDGKGNRTVMEIVVSSAFADSGGEAVVYVQVTDNPGFLALALRIEYDSDAMTLTAIENGQDFTDYQFIPAKDLRSGCQAGWFITCLNEPPKGGELLKLRFHVLEETQTGEYAVTVLPVDDGGNVNEDKEPVTLMESTGIITVK